MTPKDTSMYIHTSCVIVLLLYLFLVKPINGKYLYKLEIYMCPYIHSVHTLAVQGRMLSVPI